VTPCVDALQPCRASYGKGFLMIRLAVVRSYGRYIFSSLAAIAFGVMAQ
jgi:hypothetical protein